MIITIIGLGLIGGSMAKDLKSNQFADKIIGVDSSEEHLIKAQEIGFIDEKDSLEKAVKRSNFVILATPVDAALKLLPQILDVLPSNSVLIDVGSTKTNLIDSVKNHPKRKQYLPTHPMSGTENSGPEAAQNNLFKNKTVIFCNSEQTTPQMVDLVKKMYTSLGSEIIEMDSVSHDEHVGYVSHLSHVISYALAVSVLEKEKSDANIFNLASGGFNSTARLAKSSVNMWLPIFEQNKNFILPIIEVYLDNLLKFKTFLEKDDKENLKKFIQEANKIRKIIP